MVHFFRNFITLAVTKTCNLDLLFFAKKSPLSFFLLYTFLIFCSICSNNLCICLCSIALLAYFTLWTLLFTILTGLESEKTFFESFFKKNVFPKKKEIESLLSISQISTYRIGNLFGPVVLATAPVMLTEQLALDTFDVRMHRLQTKRIFTINQEHSFALEQVNRSIKQLLSERELYCAGRITLMRQYRPSSSSITLGNEDVSTNRATALDVAVSRDHFERARVDVEVWRQVGRENAELNRILQLDAFKHAAEVQQNSNKSFIALEQERTKRAASLDGTLLKAYGKKVFWTVAFDFTRNVITMPHKILYKGSCVVGNLCITDPAKKWVDDVPLYPQTRVDYPWMNIDLKQLYGEDILSGIVETNRQPLNARNPLGYSVIYTSPEALAASRTLAQGGTNNTEYMKQLIEADNLAATRKLELAELESQNKEKQAFLEEQFKLLETEKKHIEASRNSLHSSNSPQLSLQNLKEKEEFLDEQFKQLEKEKKAFETIRDSFETQNSPQSSSPKLIKN